MSPNEPSTSCWDKLINFWKGESSYFKFGICFTAGAIIIFALLLCTSELPKNLNEWGDFLGGYISVIALVWVILGYLQQGEELKQNTEALKAQQKELEEQAEATTELVYTSKRELKLLEDRELRSFEPILQVFIKIEEKILGVTEKSVGRSIHYAIENIGGIAFNIEIFYDFNEVTDFSKYYYISYADQRNDKRIGNPLEFRALCHHALKFKLFDKSIKVHYKDRIGRHYEKIYRIYPGENDRLWPVVTIKQHDYSPVDESII